MDVQGLPNASVGHDEAVDDRRFGSRDSWFSLCCVGLLVQVWCLVFSSNTKSGGSVVLEYVFEKMAKSFNNVVPRLLTNDTII